MKNFKFRPGLWLDTSSKWRRRLRKVKDNFHSVGGNLNWLPRQSYPCHIFRTGGRLHYLADHAPSPLRKKWKPAFLKFIQHHRKF